MRPYKCNPDLREFTRAGRARARAEDEHKKKRTEKIKEREKKTSEYMIHPPRGALPFKIDVYMCMCRSLSRSGRTKPVILYIYITFDERAQPWKNMNEKRSLSRAPLLTRCVLRILLSYILYSQSGRFLKKNNFFIIFTLTRIFFFSFCLNLIELPFRRTRVTFFYFLWKVHFDDEEVSKCGYKGVWNNAYYTHKHKVPNGAHTHAYSSERVSWSVLACDHHRERRGYISLLTHLYCSLRAYIHTLALSIYCVCNSLLIARAIVPRAAKAFVADMYMVIFKRFSCIV